MKAQNREEVFLKALANGEEPNIKPLTRKEILLKKQAERESESTGGGGAFVVKFTETNDGFVADKTFSEIFNAFQNGAYVYGLGSRPGFKTYNNVCTLTYIGSDEAAIFTCMNADVYGYVGLIQFNIFNDDTVNITNVLISEPK